jgi:hypothetical protein
MPYMNYGKPCEICGAKQYTWKMCDYKCNICDDCIDAGIIGKLNELLLGYIRNNTKFSFFKRMFELTTLEYIAYERYLSEEWLHKKKEERRRKREKIIRGEE